MPTLGRTDIIDDVAEKSGYTKKDVQSILNGLLATILMRVIHGGDIVSLQGFGRFWMADVAARQGRDPRTGDAIDLPARRRIRFAAAKPIRDELARPR